MRAAALIVLVLASPVAAQDRLAPDNPWFSEFEETCRDGEFMHEECQMGVLAAYEEYAGTSDIRCDWAEFWRVRDEEHNTEMFSVLPWQYGVEAIIQTEGVCSVIAPKGGGI